MTWDGRSDDEPQIWADLDGDGKADFAEGKLDDDNCTIAALISDRHHLDTAGLAGRRGGHAQIARLV